MDPEYGDLPNLGVVPVPPPTQRAPPASVNGLPPGVLPYAPPEQAPAQPPALVQDQGTEADFLKLVAQHPSATSYEALQYKLAYPQFDLEHISQNLEEFRRQAKIDKVDFGAVAREHPTMKKYLRDPDKAGLAMDNSALLTGSEKWIGRTEPTYGDAGAPGKPDWRYTAPAWLATVRDWPLAMSHKIDLALAAPFDVMSWAADKVNDAVGLPRTENSIFKQTAKLWQARAAIYEPWAKRDYFGNSFKEDHWLTRGTAEVLKSTAEMIPLVFMGGAAAEAGGAAGLIGFNALYSAPEMYEGAKEITGSPGKAALLTAVGAPLVGQAMAYTPLGSASGRALNQKIEEGMARVAAELSPGFWKTARMWSVKIGTDAFMGQVALGVQHAAQSSVDQAAIGMAGGDASFKEVVKSFFDGMRDPTMLGLHAVSIYKEVGRFTRARSDVKRINGAVDELERLWNANADQFQADAVRSVAQSSGDTHVYVPLDLLHEEIAKSGADPMAVMDRIFGDGGKSYAAALASHEADLKIPVERLAEMKKLGLDKIVRNEGRFDPTLEGGRKLGEMSKEFQEAYDAAIKSDPETLPEMDKAIRNALLSFAGTDGDVASHLYATVKALQTQHPELSSHEIFHAVFGRGGSFGPRAVKGQGDPGDELKGEKPGIVFKHTLAPDLPLRVEPSDPFQELQGAYWSPSSFDLTTTPRASEAKAAESRGWTPEEKAKEDLSTYRKRIAELKGKGIATDLYVQGLKEAQAAGAGWVSDKIRSDNTNRMYPRLVEAGMPFKLTETVSHEPMTAYTIDKTGAHKENTQYRWVIHPEELAGVDFDKVEAALRAKGEGKAPREEGKIRQTAAPVEDVLRKIVNDLSVFTSSDWFKDFKTDEAKISAQKAAELAHEKARENLIDAVAKGTRKFMPEERAKAEEQARQDIRKDHVYRALHWFQKGELWGDEGNTARLLHPETGKPLRLLDTDIDALMGPGIAEQIKANKAGIVTSDPRQAIDVDAAANALGFPGSSAMGDPARRMLAGLRDAVTEGQYVKQLSDLRLKERYGADLFENPQDLLLAALDSVHNEKAMGVVLRTYQALAAKLDPLSRARSAMTPEMWQAAADKLIQSKILKDTNPEVFARASMKAAQRTVDHLGGGKTRQAFDAAEATLLNHYLYKSARELANDLGPKWSEINRNGSSESVRKRLGLADPVTLNPDGTNRPAVYINAHDAVLRAIGSLSEPEGYQPDPNVVNNLIERVKDNSHDQWLSTLAWDPEVVQGVISQGKRWNRLTPEEAWQVHAMITNLQHIGKMAAGESQAIKGMEIDSAKRDLVAYLRGTTGEGPTMLQPQNLRALDTLLERRRAEGGIKGVLSAPLRWADKAADVLGWSSDASMYAWNRMSELGPVGERIMEGFRERRNQRDAYLKEFFYPWMEIRKSLDLDPKLADEAKGANLMLNLRSRADLTEVSHQWLLNLARWWGDADGRKRVGGAFGLTPGRVEEVLTKFFTPEQLDKIQAEKDLIDAKMRPQLAAMHMQRTGVQLKEAEPAPFKLTWKVVDPVSGLQTEVVREYKGGYYPIHWDGRPGMAQSRVGDFSNSGRLPKVPSEFLIERTDSASRTPDLNWAGMPQHMLRVAHNLAFGDFVQDSARVMLDRDVQKEISAYRGDDAAKGVGRWLERVALDVSGGPDSTYAAADKNAKLRILRRSLVRATVAFNYPILFAHSAHPLGTGEARYGAAYVADYAGPAMADVLNGYTEHLVTGENRLHDWALATFPELQHRSSVLREEMGRWMLDKEFHATPTNVFQKLMYAIDEHVIEGAGMAHLRFMDSAFATSTALAKYRHEIDKGTSHEEAVKLADKEVFETMPTYSQMEQPEILADKHSLRSVGVIWHTYYGTWKGIWRDARYENVVRPGEERRAATGSEPFASRALSEGETFGRMMTGLGLGLVLGAYFKGSGPEQNEKGSHWLLKRSLMAPAEVVPYAGAIVERSIDWASGKKGRALDFENSYLSPIAHTVNALGTFGDYRKTSEDRVMSLARAGAELTGFPKPLLNLGQFAYHGSEWARRSPDGAAATAVDFTSHVFYPYKWGRYSRFQGHNPFMDAASMLEDK